MTKLDLEQFAGHTPGRSQRLLKTRRYSTPERGFIGTLQRCSGGWLATLANGKQLGTYKTGTEARKQLESMAARISNTCERCGLAKKREFTAQEICECYGGENYDALLSECRAQREQIARLREALQDAVKEMRLENVNEWGDQLRNTPLSICIENSNAILDATNVRAALAQEGG